MKTILVTKYGMIFRSGKTIAIGEQGETEAMMRHLIDRVNVVYFGQWRGPPIEGVTTVESHIKDMDNLSTADQQRAGFDRDIEALSGYDVCGFIMSCGYAPTASMIDNATGSGVQGAGVRMCAPALNVVDVLDVPRLCINTDPRTYPREQEIIHMPKTMPASLLDQWGRELWQKIAGIALRRKSVYAAIETWADLPVAENTHEVESVVVSHCHVRDGMRAGSALEDAWEEILSGTNAQVYGRGWYLTNIPRVLGEERFMGGVEPGRVMALLSQATSGPIVSHTPRFYTLKIKTYAASGCVPLLWSNGPHAYDQVHRYVPRDHYLRFHSAEELREKTRELHEDPLLRNGMLEFLDDALKPRWNVLDSMIDDLLKGRERGESWIVDYGGYTRDASMGNNERRMLKDREGG